MSDAPASPAPGAPATTTPATSAQSAPAATPSPAAAEPAVPAAAPPAPAQPVTPQRAPAVAGTPVQPPAPATSATTPGPATAAQPASAQPSAPATPEPLRYDAPPKLPDGVRLDTEKLSAFDKLIGTHRLPAEARQGLVDLYLAEHASHQEQARQQQVDRWNEVRAGWRSQIFADEQLGGSGFATTQAAAIRVLDQIVPTNHRAAFDQMLLETGIGDHPAMFRLLHSIDRKLNPQKRAPAPPAPPRSRREVLYDNPRSRAGLPS